MGNDLRFSENELKSISINAMGRASELGTASVSTLAFAGNVNQDGTHSYVIRGSEHNSGYSLGFFQWDFGQKLNGIDLIHAYNNSSYVKENPDKRISESDQESSIALLQQNRTSPGTGELPNYDIRRGELGQNINEFLQTGDG